MIAACSLWNFLKTGQNFVASSVVREMTLETMSVSAAWRSSRNVART